MILTSINSFVITNPPNLLRASTQTSAPHFYIKLIFLKKNLFFASGYLRTFHSTPKNFLLPQTQTTVPLIAFLSLRVQFLDAFLSFQGESVIAFYLFKALVLFLLD